jgi:hypothetical protein
MTSARGLMNDRLSFIIKVLLASAILSFAIKYGGRLLSIEPTTTNAIVAISLPTVIIAIILAWRLFTGVSRS